MGRSEEMDTPKKVMVIGCDAALPKQILKYVEEGALPTFEKLIKGGVIAENGLVPHPTITPPNWTTIATGAWPGTHGITDYWVHTPGNELTMDSVVEGFDRSLCLVENIWEAAEKAGKKSIVFNYPSSWNTKLEDGIVVAGNSNIVGDWRSADNYGFTVCADALFATTLYPRGGIKVEVEEAEDWQNVPGTTGDEDMETELVLPFRETLVEMEPVTWHALAQDTNGDGYDRVTVSPTKDFNEAFCALSVGQWSDKLTTTLTAKSGDVKEVSFRIKLMELSGDASDFKLYMTGLVETTGWSMPPEVAGEISAYVKDGDPTLRGGGLRAFRSGWIDVDTYVETCDLQNMYLAEAAEYLLTKKDWDIFFMHEHTTDWMYHGFFRQMDPVASDDEADHVKYQDAEKRIYQSVDRMLARILSSAGDDVLTVVISDHGATADGINVGAGEALIAAGLLAIDDKIVAGLDPKMGDLAKAKALTRAIDWSKTKAAVQRAAFIYVNLKGRDPQGIVEPEDYDTVRQEIIDALMTYRDPKSGKRPFALALRKEDARPWGNYGELCGDVVYASYPWVDGQHGNILTTAEWGLGSIKALFVMNGPGIKKNEVLTRTVWITDLVPTLCYLMDLPLPSDAEGAVIYQALEDPDFKRKEHQALKDKLGELESKLA